MIYLIDLEPIEKRYTKQWSTWIPEMFYKLNTEIKIISGNIYEFQKGQFLDFNNTNKYKADQILKIANLFNEGKVKSGDIFFFYDGYHFGITALKYMAQLNDIDIKIAAIWHAGSYDPYDFITQAGMDYWSKFQEEAWFMATDFIFVATNFHKELILRSRNVLPSSIYVTGLPFDFSFSDIILPKKENIVIFPHRKSPEKRLDIFLEIEKKFPNYQFIVTTDVTNTKEEYYKLLSKAKFVFSANLQETWGIGTFEAAALGCIPIIPDDLSYKEMYNEIFRYKTIDEAENMISDERYKYKREILKKDISLIKYNSENSIHLMNKIMMKE